MSIFAQVLILLAGLLALICLFGKGLLVFTEVMLSRAEKDNDFQEQASKN